MTALIPRPEAARPYPARSEPKGWTLLQLVTTTDHKTIGKMYLVTSFGLFLIGGLMALLMRSELAVPGLQFLSNEQYNQLFTMHGTIMLLLYAVPVAYGFANYILPLQIGAPDVAFPRLNAFAYWLYVFGSLIVLAGFITPGGAADFGWTAYTPLTSALHSPGVGADLWVLGLILSGLGTILGAVNFITTVVCLRAPGMTMFRMPIFTWNILVTSVLVLLAFPTFAAALAGLAFDRHFGGHVFDPATGGAVLWQHLFWFFGHPEVYIVALPFFGIVSEIFPVFSRKPIFGYKGLIFATLGIAALSITVWAHHMYATGAVLLPFFSFMSFLIAVPTGVKLFNWIGTMWRGQVTLETPMLFSIGVSDHVPVRRTDRCAAGQPPDRFPRHRHLLRGGALPLRAVRDHRLRHLRRGVLLVSQDHRTHARRTPRQVALLDDVRRLPHDVPGSALARQRRDAAPLRRLPALRRIHHPEPDLLDRSVHPRTVHAAVRVECVQVLPIRRGRDRRRSLGLRQFPRMGHHLPTAPPQFHRTTPDPLRAAGVRAALPSHGRTYAHRSPCRADGPHRRRAGAVRNHRRRRRRGHRQRDLRGESVTGTRRLRSTGAAVLVPGRVSYAIAVAMGFYVLALILVFTFLVPRLSPGSATAVTAAVVAGFAVLLMAAMMFAARTPLHPAAVSPVRDTAADREDDIVEGWAVVLESDVDSRRVELEVTVPGAGTYRCDVRAERSIVPRTGTGATISVWVDPQHRRSLTLVGVGPSIDDASGNGRC